MSDEIPSGRLSQIFESLSCLSELQQQRQSNSPSPSSLPTSTAAQSVSHNYYIRHPDGSGYYLSSGTQTFPSASSQSHNLQQQHQYYIQQQQQHLSRYGSASLTSSPLMTKRATSFSGQIPLTNSQGTRVQHAAPTAAGGAVATAAAALQQQQTSQSTPNSPRLMPRRSHRAPPIPAKPNAALIASPALVAMDADAPWPHFSALTDNLDVHQVNNYAQAVPEINWQERCLELQLELHRSKNQAGRIRDMLREKQEHTPASTTARTTTTEFVIMDAAIMIDSSAVVLDVHHHNHHQLQHQLQQQKHLKISPNNTICPVTSAAAVAPSSATQSPSKIANGIHQHPTVVNLKASAAAASIASNTVHNHHHHSGTTTPPTTTTTAAVNFLNGGGSGIYSPFSGPSSLVNSPALGRRKRYTSTSSNCSSQFNNNYAGLDMESLEDMLRKLSELEQRVVEAEERAEEAEDKVRAMEQRLSEWPKPPHANSPIHQSQAQPQPQQPQLQVQKTSAVLPDAENTITSLEIQVEEQRQLRLHDARQVEAKAAKIKEWVTNKLRELEEQNQLLREQNVKCNQQLELLRNHIANQPNRHSSILPSGPVRNSLSLDVQDFASDTTESRRRSESLDPQESIRPLTSSYPHHQHRRNLSMEPQELERNLVAAVDGLTLTPLSGRPNSSDTDTAHDYAEIYTPSREKLPPWMKNNPALMASGGSTSTTTTSDIVGVVGTPRPPTPPLHRFPSWEAKIYQVANDGLAAGDGDHDGQESTANHGHHQSGTLGSANGSAGGGTPSRAQQTASGGFCDISVPVYATVKGRASQIRSMPFTGDSSDDSSDGEEHAVMMTHNSHNSSSTDNTETSTSGSASSPSKSLKTSSSLSPAKRSGSESPKNKTRGIPQETSPNLRIPSIRGSVISDISFESGLSDDYAIPPDAVSESTCMDASMPSLLMRASYVDSPNRKLESLEKVGHLAKLGGKLKTWRKRWFVLKNGSLTYWKSQHDINRKPQGQILLDEACRINRAEGASTFEIDTGKKVYYLTADSNATMDDWIRVLQNVQRRNATKLLLSRDDQKPTVQGWVTKVKNGHAKKCWCVLLGKMFLYFKAPGETNPLGQINMRDARVEEVEHVSDSDSEEREDPAQSQARLTVAIYPAHQGPTYLILPGKQERDNWLYHLTVVSGGGPNAGTQYEQLVQKLMETDGDPNCVLWRHPILLHTKDTITSPLSSLHSETIQPEAIKLFKSCQLFMSVAVNQPGIDYHVVLAQNALQHCLDMPELQTEMICILAKQTSRHTGQKLSVGVQVNKKLGKQTRQLLLCATQSLFTCDTQQGGAAQANGSSPTSIQAPAPPPIIDCKSNPPAYTFVQGWQLLSLAVSLFVPKSSRLLWYLKLHLSRNADTKTETGKYAAYCERALERTLKNGGRETKPSRMEVLSILLKNPYHHSLPHAIPVHMMNATYQVISFDGSTTIEEFQSTLAQEIGSRDAANGFCLFSDDPIEKDLEHYLDPQAKLCDVISKWETALREKGSGKFENSRVIQLTYKNRLYWKHTIKFETDKEKLLLCYQTNQQIVQGRFPLSRDLALELASLMSQIDMGDYSLEKSRGSGNMNNAGLKALDKFYPYRYRDAMTPEQLKEIQDLLIAKWMLLKGRSTLDCVRIYLTCCRKWPFFGAALFQAKPRHSDQAMAWLAVSEDALNVLELSSMAPLARYPYTSVMTFGGCQDDFMLVVGNEDNLVTTGSTNEQKLLFAMSKPKILEITLLIADYMNALGHTLPGTPQMNTLTRNGSHRSLRSRPVPGTCIATGGGASTNATTTAHNTLNSHATHTLNSNHSHTLNSSHYSGVVGLGGGVGGSHQNTMSSSHGGQPDILKSTPDHQRMQK